MLNGACWMLPAARCMLYADETLMLMIMLILMMSSMVAVMVGYGDEHGDHKW